MLGDLRIHHQQDFAGAAMMYQLAVNTATRREFGSNLYLIGKVGANTGRLCACTSLWLNAACYPDTRHGHDSHV